MMGHVYRQLAVDGPIKASFGDVHQHIREAHFGAAQQVHGVSSKVDEISTDVKHLSTTLGAVEEKMISAVKEKLDAAMKEKLDAATEQQKKHAAEQLKALVEAVEGKLNGVDVASMSKLALPSPIDIQKAAGDMDEGLIDPAKLPGFATRSPPSSPWKRNNPPEPDMELLELPAHSPLPVFPPAALSEANNKLQRSNAQIAILVAQLHRMGYQLRTSTTRNSQFVEIAAQWTEGKLSDKDLFTKLNRLLEGQDVAVDPDMD
jgi:outer membrane murein-binding lipoprotein Lpp